MDSESTEQRRKRLAALIIDRWSASGHIRPEQRERYEILAMEAAYVAQCMLEPSMTLNAIVQLPNLFTDRMGSHNAHLVDPISERIKHTWGRSLEDLIKKCYPEFTSMAPASVEHESKLRDIRLVYDHTPHLRVLIMEGETIKAGQQLEFKELKFRITCWVGEQP